MELILKKIKPLFNRILITADRYTKDKKEGGIVVESSGALKSLQKVVAVGTLVRDVKVGDLVKLNPARYAIKRYGENSVKEDLGLNKVVTYNFNIVELNDEEHLLIFEDDIEYVAEEVESRHRFSKKLIVPEENNKIIMN